MFLTRSIPLIAAALLLGSPIQAQQSAPTNNAAPPAAETAAAGLQPWQIRRERFSQITKALQTGNDTEARSNFARIIRDYESRPFQLTPLESMDLLGSVFVPQAGLEKLMPLVVAQAALGLYDAKRFASPGAMADLLQGEKFLERAFILAGPQQAAKSRNFLIDKSEVAARLVQQGLKLAETEARYPEYDVKWVTALGKGLDFCPAGTTCPPHEAAKQEDWPRLWAEVREEITRYYKIEPAKPTPSSQNGKP
ncbi:hypothetical protein [Roseateles toxinivorans]|uniref:Uncharacterized protein n=1 Tax=Roseateles toxinivorans TaxID=270368 RepID=A0A4V3CTD6_9BURK|nr:hypothetical protein [Roseateles toxinivorans]TDP71417.1 hypothetical protein DES47_103398 [Roseateles toxinivorans]